MRSLGFPIDGPGLQIGVLPEQLLHTELRLGRELLGTPNVRDALFEKRERTLQLEVVGLQSTDDLLQPPEPCLEPVCGLGSALLFDRSVL